MKKFIASIFCVLFVFYGSTYGGSNLNDESLTEEDYIKYGISKEINTLNYYVSVYNVFSDLAEENKNILPRYNSNKSGKFFQKIFNKSVIDRILLKKISILEKRQLLGSYSLIYSDFAGLYLINNMQKIYYNENIRIESLMAYTKICIYELIGKELSENKVVFPEEKILFFIKMVERDLWALNHMLMEKETLDKDTLKIITEDINLYRKKLNEINFLDYEKNLKKINSLY